MSRLSKFGSCYLLVGFLQSKLQFTYVINYDADLSVGIATIDVNVILIIVVVLV